MDLLFEANRLAGELANELRRSLISEAEVKSDKRIIVAYSGHFQPFHQGHFKIYKTLVKKFGRDNVYITTTNETDELENPMTYADKKQVIMKMFDIEDGKFQEVQNPYVPAELLQKFNPKATSFVTVVSDEDAAVLSKSKYFHPYVESPSLQTYDKAAYYLTVPELRATIGGQHLTGPQIMQVLGSSKTSDAMKEKIFQALYGKSDAGILDIISNKAKDGAEKVDGKFTKTQATGQANKTSYKKTDAGGQDTDADEDGKSDKTPPMQRMIVNPDTGREIKVQSALKYPRWKPVYKKAEKFLKATGIDRKDRVKEPEVNQRYRAREKNMKKDELAIYLGDMLSEHLHSQFSRDGVTLNVPGLGEVLLRLGQNRTDEVTRYPKSTLLTEGAPKSHIQHPYDDVEMSFSDLKGLVSQALTGNLESATEKTDGQNILFTVRDGKVVFARNTQHTKGNGAAAMDAQEFKDFFAKHGDQVSDSFGRAAQDVQSAVDALPDAMKKAVFNNGSRFASAEILNSQLANTIPYNTNVIMLLSVRDYDPETGNPTSMDINAADALADVMSRAGTDKQPTYKITGKNKIQFGTSDTDRQNAQKYTDAITELQARYNLTDDNTIGDFLAGQWSELIDAQNAWTPEEKELLLRRFVAGDKSFGVRSIKDPAKKELFYELEKPSKELQAKFIRSIKSIVLNVGADALNRATNLLGQSDGTREKLKAKFKDAVEAIKKSGQPEYIDKTKKELDHLKDIGIDKISPAEGIVFTHNGQLYKFTGAFAPVNQIVSINTYKLNPAARSADDEVGGESPTSAAGTQPKRAPVVVYPGRFQPFHAGHYSVYKHLVDKYGKENVYIGTSDKTDGAKSPFNFNEKQSIMSRMFGIPTDKIVQVKNPYAPKEITDPFPQDTPFITALSEKEAERLSVGNYYKPLPQDGNSLGNYRDVGYFTVVPDFEADVDGQNISGTAIRSVLSDPQRSVEDKKKMFATMYGKFDQDVFDLITSKLATATDPVKKTRKAAMADPATQRQSAQPDDRAKGKGDILNKTIRNPETDNDILVKTALKYPKDHPAYKAAAKLVRNEVVILEGGNAVEANSKIPNEFAQSTAQHAANMVGFGKIAGTLVGSTFKPIMNDLDFATDIDDVKKVIGYTGTDKKEFFVALKQYLTDKGIEATITPGFQQFSLSVPLTDSTGKQQPAVGDDGKSGSQPGNVQIDFMMGDLQFMKRFLTNGDTSNTSSSYRNNLFMVILPNLAMDTDTPGVKKRFLINMRDGIYEEYFTEKPNGKRETVSKKLVSNDVDFLAKVMFGPKSTFAEIDTYEKLVDRLQKPDVSFRDKLPKIVADYETMLTKMKMAPAKQLPSADKKAPSGEKQAEPDAVKQVPSDVGSKKVRNPETDNDILVKTALKYDADHPAHKAAEKVVRNTK